MRRFSFALVFILLIYVFYSCKESKEFMLIRDENFAYPSLRFEPKNGKVLYSLHEQYFVFGYYSNIEIFDSVVVNTLCEKLNRKKLLSWVNITFLDYGKYSTYHDGKILSSDNANILLSVVWDIEDPKTLKVGWGNDYEKRKLSFECNLKAEYQEFTSQNLRDN